MKTITICGKKYPIECSAYSYVKFVNFFDRSMTEDIQVLKDYLVRQTIISNQVAEKNLSDQEKISFVSEYMQSYIGDFISSITRIAWMMIYTVNPDIEEYETWLKSIKKFNIDDDWIVEVAEFAVNCFC